MIKKLLLAAAVIAVIALVVREFPALRREIRIWRM
jgi:hypothetical protein